MKQTIPMINIENTISQICFEYNRITDKKQWEHLAEDDLLYEMMSSILGSQVTYEVCLSATDKLKSEMLITWDAYYDNSTIYQSRVEEILSSELKDSFGNKLPSYRFPKIKAKHVADSMNNIAINFGSLKSLVESVNSEFELRKVLIKNIVGFGPKQSSMFIRNIGFSDCLAIIDSHILKFLKLIGIYENKYPSSLANYETVENLFIEYAKKFGHSVGCVDYAIWILMRVLKEEYAI